MKFTLYRAYNEESPYQRSLPPLGIGYLISYLKKNNPDVEPIFCSRAEDILATKPDIIGISSATENFPHAIEVAKKIKEKSKVPIIIGGMHITSLPHKLPDCFDIAVLGEGELTLSELMGVFKTDNLIFKKDSLEKIKGICFHDNDKVIVNPMRELMPNLDVLPYPDREATGDNWILSPRDEVHLVTSRGCPYDCSFCAASKLWQKYRYFSVEYVVAEVEYLMNKYQPEEVYFFDDLFIGNLKRFREICGEFKKRNFHKKTVFKSYARVDLVNDELCSLFKDLNFKYIDLGIEANNETALTFLNKRNVTPEINQRAMDCLAKYGISIGVNIIIGSCPETAEDIEKTYQFVLKNKDIIDRISFGPLLPIPGTKVWDYALEKGIISEDLDWSRLSYDMDNFDIEKYPLMSEKLSKDELYEFYKKFRSISREITRDGYLKYLDHKANVRKYRIIELENELKTLKGSRLIRAAEKLRNIYRES